MARGIAPSKAQKEIVKKMNKFHKKMPRLLSNIQSEWPDLSLDQDEVGIRERDNLKTQIIM